MNYLSGGSNSTCVMTYSHDGFGLGHLRRNTTIASHLARDIPKSSVLMLIGCPAGAVFSLPPGVDFIKLPSIIKRDTGVWHPLRLRIGFDKTKELRIATIQQVARVFHPQLLLVDHVPVGVWGELLPLLEMLKRREKTHQLFPTFEVNVLPVRILANREWCVCQCHASEASGRTLSKAETPTKIVLLN